MNPGLVLLGFFMGTEAIGWIGALFTRPEIKGWYATLKQSPLNPPSWVFGPVWTILYGLMGSAAFLVWYFGPGQYAFPLTVYCVQLALNLLWSFLFFKLHNPLLALIDIVLMWIAIAATIWLFALISAIAAWMLVPYLAWVTFAGYLNFSVYKLNS